MSGSALLKSLLAFRVLIGALTAIGLSAPVVAATGFIDRFDRPTLPLDPEARTGWAFRTGDGEAKMDFRQQGDHATIEVDARQDRRNIWWAMIRRSVSADIDEAELARPDRELRVEARIRSSAAPRRVNLHFNHSRTTDFHSHLMEYDLPDNDWRVISFTTKDFDALPDDEVFVQMAMMDWGRDLFRLDVDYIKVEVVDPARSGPDLGNPLSYRPSLPPPGTYAASIEVSEDAIVDSAYPEVNFRNWTDMSDGDRSPALSISSSQMIVLRWELSALRGRAPQGWGLLELTTESVQWAPTHLEEFGYLRVVEILNGDEDWQRETVTRDSLFGGKEEREVLGQMIVDAPPSFERGGKTLIPVSPPVLERLISGRTRGLAIYAQGAINASFRSSESADEAQRPRLHFNLSGHQ